MTDKLFTKRLRDLTDEAIRESLAEISVEFEKRFGPAALTASPPVVEREAIARAEGEAPIPNAASVWRDAYVAVYGCEPTHPVAAYQGAYDVIAQAMRDAILSTPVAQGDEVRDALERVLEALTPHGETKAAYMGEFSWTEWLPDENGVEQGHQRTVPWTTIKEIMATIRDRAGVEKLDEADALATLTKGARDAG